MASSSAPLTTLDIVAHEFGHAVTGKTAGLIYQGESGALNEGDVGHLRRGDRGPHQRLGHRKPRGVSARIATRPARPVMPCGA